MGIFFIFERGIKTFVVLFGGFLFVVFHGYFVLLGSFLESR